MRMFSSSANCARMPPADLLVEPGREHVALEQHDVVDAEPAQVEGGGGAEGAAADHNDVCRASGSPLRSLPNGCQSPVAPPPHLIMLSCSSGKLSFACRS